MDIMKLGAQLLLNKLGDGSKAEDEAQVTGAISNLLGGKDGAFDLGAVVEGLKGNGLSNLAESWLGDGDNEEISPAQVKSLFGEGKIANMASELGSDEDSVLSGLKEMIPQLIDKSSSGGSLLDSLGGVAGLAKKLF